MPSPIGHALGSLIVGAPQRRGWLLLALVGIAPDLDLLWGRHSAETHSVGAAVIAGFVLATALRVRTNLTVRTYFRVFLVVTLVWLAHPVMDALGEDSSAPFGVMLWWPFSQQFVIAPFHIFDSAYRAYWKPDFWPHNIVAVAKEIMILAPLAIGAALWRRIRA